MAERVTSLFGGHRQPADRPPASWPTVQPAACLQSFGYATVTSSAPSSSTGPARRDTDDSLTSYLRRCRHSYRLRNRRSRPFNPDFLGGFPPKPRSVLRNRQGILRLSGVSSCAREGETHRRTLQDPKLPHLGGNLQRRVACDRHLPDRLNPADPTRQVDGAVIVQASTGRCTGLLANHCNEQGRGGLRSQKRGG